MLSEFTVYFDVDETLILVEDLPSNVTPTCNLNGVRYEPHYGNIDRLKQHALRGHKVIVWSMSGENWARAVVKDLGLEDFVWDCLSKPIFFYDDKPVNDFM